jgi:hypothetical protein
MILTVSTTVDSAFIQDRSSLNRTIWNSYTRPHCCFFSVVSRTRIYRKGCPVRRVVAACSVGSKGFRPVPVPRNLLTLHLPHAYLPAACRCHATFWHGSPLLQARSDDNKSISALTGNNFSQNGETLLASNSKSSHG